MMKIIKNNIIKSIAAIATIFLLSQATCKYGFNDTAPIPLDVKTFRVNYFENKAQYVNAQLSPQLTEKVRQKIIGTTRLKQTDNPDAHYDISGYVNQYYVTTIAVNNSTASGNRLTVGFHLSFKNNLDNTKDFEADLTRTFDFSGNSSLSEVDNALLPEILRNMTDEIFNKIFSNW